MQEMFGKRITVFFRIRVFIPIQKINELIVSISPTTVILPTIPQVRSLRDRGNETAVLLEREIYLPK